MLVRGVVRDPDAAGAVVSSVQVTDDLRHAKIFLRLDGTGPSGAGAARQTALVRAMERARGFVRKELAARLKLRYAPEVSFHWDEGMDHAARVEALLAEIKREEQGGSR